MNATAPVTLAYAGEVYFRYAGPFKNDNQARLMVEDLFANGEVDASNNPIIHCRAVYLRETCVKPNRAPLQRRPFTPNREDNSMTRDLYQETTDRIIAKLEAGTAPWVKGWNASTSMPMNAVGNRPYSGINVLLFWLSADKGYKSPRYLTYKQAKEAGGHVREGEKATRIFFFKQLTITEKETDEEKQIPMLREYYVFNVEQCDGLPDRIKFGPSYTNKQNPDTREELAEAFIKATGADFREGAGKPCYVPSKDFVTVPGWSDFHSMPEYYAAAFHELVHWTGHKSRLDRDLKGRFDKHAYAAKELVAELGAAFLCAEFGFDNAHDNQAAYIARWLDLLKSDKRAIFTAASKAQKAADYMRGLAIAEPMLIAA